MTPYGPGFFGITIRSQTKTLSNGESPGSIARILVRGTGPRGPPARRAQTTRPRRVHGALRLDDSPEPLPPSDVDLIAACRAGDSTAHLDRCRAPVGLPTGACGSGGVQIRSRGACCARPPAA